MEGRYMKILLTILLGMLPEVLYFTLFITYTKNIKEKRIKLFLLISVFYLLCITTIKYQILCYMAFVVSIFIILKLLYKEKAQIIDIFIVGVSYLWLSILSFVLMNFTNKDLSNYAIIYIIQRILLFMPFIFRNKFNTIYKKYCKLWNRNDTEKRPIKSITLRNVSLVIINIAIFNRLCYNIYKQLYAGLSYISTPISRRVDVFNVCSFFALFKKN